jgi:hypothetical protein
MFPPGLVEMNVGIDEPGKEMEAGGVDYLCGGPIKVRPYRDNSAVHDADIRGNQLLGCH